MFITFDNAESVGDPLAGSAMAKAVDESLGDGDIQVDFPDINVDTERGAAVLENVGADDSRPAGNYAPFMADGDFSKDEYLAAVGSKLIIGDTDHSGNVVASSDGNFHPIDFDISGRDLQQINDRTGGRLFDGMENEASQYTELYDFDINDGDLRRVTTQLAQQVDMGTLESRLSSSEAISSEERKTVIDNVTALRQGDI
jgi:hypothetical protein